MALKSNFFDLLTSLLLPVIDRVFHTSNDIVLNRDFTIEYLQKYGII